MNLYLLLAISLILGGVAVYLTKRRNITRSKPLVVKSDNSPLHLEDVNQSLEDYIQLLNGLRKKILGSKKLEQLSFKTIDPAEINQAISDSIESGFFNEVIDEYIHEEIGDIESLAYSIMEISKQNIRIPAYKLQKIELKEPYIHSDLQEYICNSLERGKYIITPDIESLKKFILTLISYSNNKFYEFSLEK